MKLSLRQEEFVRELETTKVGHSFIYLNDHGRMCPSGIACEVAIRLGLPLSREEDRGIVSYKGKKALIPDVVAKFFGLKSSHLYGVNRQSKSLKDVAKVIRENPTDFFEEQDEQSYRHQRKGKSDSADAVHDEGATEGGIGVPESGA